MDARRRYKILARPTDPLRAVCPLHGSVGLPSEQDAHQPLTSITRKIYTKVVSAHSEAKAIAWQIIISRDLFGMKLDLDDEISSLRYTNDFYLYEGENDKERFAWVKNIVEVYIDRFGSINDFDQLWHARCAKLPELFRKEAIRQNMWKHDPVESVDLGEVGSYWQAVLEHRIADDVAEWEIVITSRDRDDGFQEFRSFSSEAAAISWFEGLRKLYTSDEEPEISTSTAPGLSM